MNISPKVVFEVGVGSSRFCKTRKYWSGGIECHIFEPHPYFYKKITLEALSFPNVKTYNFGILDKNGEHELYLINNCSFFKGVDSPFNFGINNSSEVQGGNSNLEVMYSTDKVWANVATIDRFDKGNIDILFLDMEGSEFFALLHLVSRPILISLRYHYQGGYNYNYGQYINGWLQQNNYIFYGRTETELCFINSNKFKP
jgi:hypothetical protein